MIAVLLLALANLWVVDSAMNYQARFLFGCWPATSFSNGQTVLTEDYWLEKVAEIELNPVAVFYHSRVKHRALLYFMGLLAVVGWSGSFLLKIVRADEDAEGGTKTPSWPAMFSSLTLSVMAGGILYVLAIEATASPDPDALWCISGSRKAWASLGAIGAGLFIVLFFDWFKTFVESIWDRFK